MKERKSNRLKNYDYSKNGSYFITICIKNRINCFGKIKDGKMILNKFGLIVKNQWLWLKNRFDYIKLDEFIIMPDHFHGILIIDKKNIIKNVNLINRRDSRTD